MYKFSQVDWGEDDGAGDTGLREYFVEIPEFREIIAGKMRYVIGRKGTGKSAIAEKIRIESGNRYNWFYSDLSFKDFPLSDFRSLEDKSQSGKAKFIPIWMFLIYTKLISLLLSDEGCSGDNKEKLYTFINKNFPASDIGFSDIIKNVTSNRAKVLFFNVLSAGHDRTNECQTYVHYARVTDSLRDLLGNMKSNSFFFMLFDELDEDFSANSKSFQLVLLSLFRAIELVYKNLNKSGNINFRPVLFLRSDIFDSLKDNDLNKLDDYIFRLNWSQYSGSDYDLKSVVEARIKASLGNRDATWDYIVDEFDLDKPTYMNSLWDFMLNRTYERPRDIIKFLKLCRKKNVPGMLTAEYIKKAEIDYSKWLFKELDNELYAHNKIWDKAAMLISNIGKECF